MLNIRNAIYLHDKVLKLEFDEYDGQYIVDMQDYINKNQQFNLINELNDNSKFADYMLDHGVIFWANGFDIAPEYLFFLANRNDHDYRKLFVDWGYL